MKMFDLNINKNINIDIKNMLSKNTENKCSKIFDFVIANFNDFYLENMLQISTIMLKYSLEKFSKN